MIKFVNIFVELKLPVLILEQIAVTNIFILAALSWQVLNKRETKYVPINEISNCQTIPYYFILLRVSAVKNIIEVKSVGGGALKSREACELEEIVVASRVWEGNSVDGVHLPMLKL